jgi:osmoprotectant transport system substrate-binding protein
MGKLLGVVLLLTVLTLAGCGGGGSGTTATGKPGNGATITVGSKKDGDGQMLGAMYGRLLENQGYKVNYKLALGDTPFLNNAIQSGAVDIYPEFAGSMVSRYKLAPTTDAHQAYAEANDYFQKNLGATWLDAAYNLNDSYGICTSPANASKFNLTSVADIANQNGKLTIASQSDGIDAAINPVKQGYGIQFKDVKMLDEQASYAAVTSGDVDLLVCYTLDSTLVQSGFVVLKDPKNVFPQYYVPAPVVRTSVLTAHPDIKDTLNALAPKLNTDAQFQLVKQITGDNAKDPKDVAKTWLQQQGLLPAS